MSQSDSDRATGRKVGDADVASNQRTVILEVGAAYNRDGLTMPGPNGANGRRVLSLDMLMNHSFYWQWLNEHEAAEVLMELYVARTRRMQ